MNYPDEKEIFAISSPAVKLLWARGIKVGVGQYYCNLMLISSLTKSELVSDIVWKKYKYDLQKIEGYVFSDTKITNVKAFTHFWNWLNGAESKIVHEELSLDDYIDMLEYLSYFKCFQMGLTDLGDYLVEILSYRDTESGDKLIKIKDKLTNFVETINSVNKFSNVLLIKLREKVNDIGAKLTDKKI